jgi:hypothetical protein
LPATCFRSSSITSVTIVLGSSNCRRHTAITVDRDTAVALPLPRQAHARLASQDGQCRALGIWPRRSPAARTRGLQSTRAARCCFG